MFHIMVLNDGETFTTLDGCTILAIDDKWYEHADLDDVIKNYLTDTRLQSEVQVVTIFQ